MVGRIAVASLWFVAAWVGFGIIAYFTGLPDSFGAVIGAIAAAFVFVDPSGALWRREAATGRSPGAVSRGLDPGRVVQ